MKEKGITYVLGVVFYICALLAFILWTASYFGPLHVLSIITYLGATALFFWTIRTIIKF